MRTNLAKAQAHIDGEIAQSDADLAEVYALDAVDFVLAAVGEAESGVLDAKYSRASALVVSS